MTRRLTVALVATAALALLLAGVGTLVLAGIGARQATEADLRSQAGQLRDEVVEVADDQGRVSDSRLDRLRRLADLEGLGLQVRGPAGAIVVDGLPEVVPLAALDLERLQAGEVVSGWDGRTAWAASGTTFECGRSSSAAGPCVAVVGVTDSLDLFLGQGVRWFLLASVAVLALAVLVGRRLARRLTAPLQATERATRRLAAGDLAARVTSTDGDDEVSSLARSVNALAEALEQARSAERQFLLSVSHDLRTPLTSIRGYAEALVDGTEPDGASAGRVIGGQAARLERLVTDLLDLGSLDAGGFALATERTDVVVVVAEVVEALGPAAAGAEVRVRLESAGPAVALADPQRLAQVVANLTDNALKHARATVVVSVGVDGSGVRIDVDDDGAGIDPADRDRVFDRLWTSDRRQARPGAGTGLGLAIARELVVAMGGSVAVTASPAGGARLSVTLPGAPTAR